MQLHALVEECAAAAVKPSSPPGRNSEKPVLPYLTDRDPVPLSPDEDLPVK
jgi:hypothetical protein